MPYEDPPIIYQVFWQGSLIGELRNIYCGDGFRFDGKWTPVDGSLSTRLNELLEEQEVLITLKSEVEERTYRLGEISEGRMHLLPHFPDFAIKPRKWWQLWRWE